MIVSVDNNGLSLQVDVSARLHPASEANQTHPRAFYVYAHVDQRGTIFYIGKGSGRRAWNEDRHPLWHRYVDHRTGGKFEVRILADGLSTGQAEHLESQWLAQEVATLVNWVNMARRSDYQAIDRFHQLRNQNRALAQSARELESEAPAKAAEMYAVAVSAIAQYAYIKFELGLVGELIDEENAELGFAGDIAILERYAMVLLKLGRVDDAKVAVDDYATTYKRDLGRTPFKKIIDRIDKAGRRINPDVR